VAHEDLPGATDAELMAGLARQIKAMRTPDRADTARYIASQIMIELCDRHEIPIPRNDYHQGGHDGKTTHT
jgi:hypothetical protein